MDQLEAASVALGHLTSKVVFLGGATVGLWRTDPLTRAPRVTFDIDLVAEVTTLTAYTEFQQSMRRRGFSEDRESGVICRWRGPGGLVLDAVPLDARLAGMHGMWLAPAVKNGIPYVLPSGATVRVVPPAWLLVLKVEAFADRGRDDPIGSRDFEDVVLLVDGRPELEVEFAALPETARTFARALLTRIGALRDFEYGVEGALTGPGARDRALDVTLRRLQRLINAA